MKLKRYKLGREAIAKAGNHSLMCAGIVADKDGDYYKASEVDALLEAIGAGGVSGRITQKTTEQHRGEFESALFEALRDCNPLICKDTLALKWSDGTYREKTVNPMWWAWRAAKGVEE